MSVYLRLYIYYLFQFSDSILSRSGLVIINSTVISRLILVRNPRIQHTQTYSNRNLLD